MIFGENRAIGSHMAENILADGLIAPHCDRIFKLSLN